ncbi:MAG: double-strand break repair protein AddB, partial [Pseudomonadota bacterium]
MTLFALPPGADFARAFAAGFWSRHGALPPEEIARIEILLNNRRSVRAVEAALAEEAPGAVLLPRLAVLAELGADPLAVADPPAIAPLSRLLRLTRLVEAFLAQEEGARVAPLAAAPDLARALAALMDECDEEDVPLAALDRATAGEHADHWSRTLEFLEIIRTAWPAIVAESDGGAPGPKARQRAAVMARIAAWREAPPSHPVIAAASTGSVASTALLLAEIARLPQGAVVLPGFDPGVAPDIWEPVLAGAAPEHPFAPFRRLFSLTGADPAEVAPWAPVPPAPRAALLTQAMRPAPVTDAWHRAGPELGATLLEATAGVSLAEAASPREEAATIALATRQALETPGKTVLILTQDAALARRIGAE